MMNRLCMAWLLIASSSAFAASYEQANAIRETCQADGDLASMAYKKKIAGGDLAAVLAARHDAATDQSDRDAVKSLLDVAVMVRDTEFGSARSAYMAAWSRCMDANKPK